MGVLKMFLKVIILIFFAFDQQEKDAKYERYKDDSKLRKIFARWLRWLISIYLGLIFWLVVVE